MATLFGSQDNTAPLAESKEPAWFSNSAKRVIPNHLVPKKKIGFQLSAVASKKDAKAHTHAAGAGSTQTFNSTDFNLISFGNTSNTPASSHADTSLLLAGSANDSVSYDREDLPLYNNKEDVPPSRSLYDLNDEVIISLNKPTQHTESFINKDPRNFNNAFSSRPDAPQSADDDAAAALKNPLSNSEAAILVFGYPEPLANQVIAYFSEFGTVLEDFEAAKASEKSKLRSMATVTAAGAFTSDFESRSAVSPPIFSGPSWVKLTYDNPSSAMDALQESGSVFNGAIIGVAPYSKDTIEKLQKRKLESSEDIGGGMRLFSSTEARPTEKGVIGENDIQASYIKRLEVKDGSEMFLKANVTQPNGEKKDTAKLGWWASLSNYFFGFHDL